MVTLYDAAGRPEEIDEAAFGQMPADAIALKYNDAVSGAEWITDVARLAELRREDAPLAYVTAERLERIERHLEVLIGMIRKDK